MKLNDRRRQIVDLLVNQESATLDELSDRFGVSKMTIHRDLDELELVGLLRKVRGGATVAASTQFESDFRHRELKATDEKLGIARAAVNLVEPGMSVILDDSSTASLMAAFLVEKKPLTVITNGLDIMDKLAGETGITLVGLGGTYARKFNGFFGIVTEEALAGLHADVAFVSTSAIQGFRAFHQDQEIVRLKRQMMDASERCYLLSDNSKFNRTALHFQADLASFAGLITGGSLSPYQREPLAAAGIHIVMAPAGKSHSKGGEKQ